MSAGGSVKSTGKVFRPKWWAALLTIAVVAGTVRLGNWQGHRAAYRQGQQAEQSAAMRLSPLSASDVISAREPATALRYRRVALTGKFVAERLFFADNRISDGKAGYGVIQVFEFSPGEGTATRRVLVDRGWIAAPADHARLPDVATPAESVGIEGQVNSAPSRNPGTADNTDGQRLNYVNIGELASRLGAPLEPFVLEQTAGAGFTGVARPAPGANFEKNLIYQVQWYSFAALAVVLFVVLSFRRQETP